MITPVIPLSLGARSFEEYLNTIPHRSADQAWVLDSLEVTLTTASYL
jgi:hypothetical protein